MKEERDKDENVISGMRERVINRNLNGNRGTMGERETYGNTVEGGGTFTIMCDEVDKLKLKHLAPNLWRHMNANFYLTFLTFTPGLW